MTTQSGETAAMTQTIHDLLNELAAWQRNASIGDNGERPHFDLSLSDRDYKTWEADAYSFYDGSGQGAGETPEQALAACLDDLRQSDSRAAKQEREWVVSALARSLSISQDEARRRLRGVEGWPDD